MQSTEAVNYVLNKLSKNADWEEAVDNLNEMLEKKSEVKDTEDEKESDAEDAEDEKESDEEESSEENKEVPTNKEEENMSGISDVADRININMPGGDGNFGGGGALMAALASGNNKNEWWPLLLLLGLGGRRGGLLGGGGDEGSCTGAVDLGVIIQGLSDLKASVPTTALETQAAIQLALQNLQGQITNGLIAIGDKVTSSATTNLIATNQVGTLVQTGALQTQIAINTDGERTRALVLAGIERANAINEANLNRELAVAQSALLNSHAARHAEGLSVQVTNNLTNQQAQFQRQSQEDARYAALFAQLQHAQNSIVAVGSTLTGTGQSNANTSVK